MSSLKAFSNQLRQLSRRGSAYDFVKNVFKSAKTTIKTTRNFWVPVLLLGTDRTKRIVFRNGLATELDWAEYWHMRDGVEQLFGGSFKIQKSKAGYCIRGEGNGLFFFDLSLKGSHSHLKSALSLISKGWIIEQLDDWLFQFEKNLSKYAIRQLDKDIFRVKSDKIEIIGPYDSVRAYFSECEDGKYDCDFKNKVVLDVGGFCGETAAFFAEQGARKVVIYEPVTSHQEFIRKNMVLNNIAAELHGEGIGQKDGFLIIRYDSEDLGFGQPSKAKNELRIKIRNINTVIEESKADIAKFDCEGAEASLINLPQATLRRISFYIIEVHSQEIRNGIIDQFNRAGFRQSRNLVDQPEDNISILYFEKIAI